MRVETSDVPRRLVLGDGLRERAARAALDAAPSEACGVLLGRRRAGVVLVRDLVVLANRARCDPGAAAGRFEIAAEDIARHLPAGAADARRPSLVGFWHSHPGAAAVLSPLDRRGAWAGYAQLVVGGSPRRAAPSADAPRGGPSGDPGGDPGGDRGPELCAAWLAAGRFHALEIVARAHRALRGQRNVV